MAKKRRKSKIVLPLWLAVLLVILIVVALYYCYAKGYIKFPDNNIASEDSGDASFMDNAPSAGNGNLNIYFLDIGQGDCIFIIYPDGKTMIIDAGENKSYVKDKISAAAKKLNIEEFDYLLLTHADADRSEERRVGKEC